MANRVFTDNSEARKMLGQYIDSGLIDTYFDMMLANLNIPEFASYLRFTSQTSDSLRLVDPLFPGVIEAIKLPARSEPLTALFRFSALSGFQRKLITELSLGESKSIDSLSDIYHKTYGLNIIFNSIPPKIDPLSGKITLQSHVALLLKIILKKVNELMKYTSRKLTEENSQEINFFSYFPAIKKNYLVYNMILRNFEYPPKIIIYDNACNLCTTCLMRYLFN